MPCDYKRYPSNWHTEIRPRILERARNRCEWCGVENGALGIRGHDGTFYAHGDDEARACSSGLAAPDAKVVRIVLTIAHLYNPDPMCCDDDNLAALCQRCHNRLDAPMRAAHRRKTSASNKGQMDMLDKLDTLFPI